MKMFNVKRMIGALVACGLTMAVTATPAHASFVLKLSDGTTTKTVVDQQVLAPTDLDSTVGSILYAGGFGVWNVLIGIGTSDPIENPLYPHLHLNVVAHSTTGGILTVALTDTDFSTNPAVYTLQVGGVTDARRSMRRPGERRGP